jgi:membrane protein DedA with SNARE-associated domain
VIEAILLSSLSGLTTYVYGIATGLVKAYGIAAVFFLMLLESSSIPVPSEVIMPLAGLLAHNHLMLFYPALIASIAGSAVGIAIDYLIGYYIGKDIVYKHLRLFHISKESLEAFDAWFERNSVAAIFLTRLVPVIRTVMSFPAGFAKMPPKRFFTYSLSGAAIWNVVLMLFGFYLLSSKSAVEIMSAIGVLAIVLYVAYRYAMKRINAK